MVMGRGAYPITVLAFWDTLRHEKKAPFVYIWIFHFYGTGYLLLLRRQSINKQNGIISALWPLHTETGNSSPVYVFSGSQEVKEVQQERYLGDILSCDGKNQKNITARKNKGTGIITQIMSILEDICFGNYYFQVAIILRNYLLISSLLTNG